MDSSIISPETPRLSRLVPAIALIERTRWDDPDDDYQGGRGCEDSTLPPQEQEIWFDPSELESMLISEGRFMQGQALVMDGGYGSRRIRGGEYTTILSDITQNAQRLRRLLEAPRLESISICNWSGRINSWREPSDRELSVEYFAGEAMQDCPVRPSTETSGRLYAINMLRRPSRGVLVVDERIIGDITAVRDALRTYAMCPLRMTT